MALVLAKCTSCGEKIQLENTKEIGFCMHCGTKINIKEAVKLVDKDNGDLISNYYSIIDTAFGGRNLYEAEQYCNKVIEINHKEYRAWLLKGKAVGWQTSSQYYRFGEAISCWVKAIEFCDEEKKYDLIAKIEQEIKNLSLAIINRKTEEIELLIDDDEEYSIFGDELEKIIRSLLILYPDDDETTLSRFLDPLLKSICYSVIEFFESTVYKKYIEKDGHQDKNDIVTFAKGIEKCRIALQYVIMLGSDEKECMQDAYENIIKYNKLFMEECALNDEIKASRKKEIDKFEEKYAIWLERVKKIENEKKIEEQNKYWEEYPEEYDKFLKDEAFKQELKQNLDDKQSEFDDYCKEIDKKIEKFKKDKASFNFFAIKQKREIDDEIDKLKSSIGRFRISCGLESAIKEFNKTNESFSL